MVKNLLLFTRDAIETDPKGIKKEFRRIDFESQELSRDSKDFWRCVDQLDQGGTLALMSHGNARGPLLISGTTGPDMTVAQFQKLTLILMNRSVSFYCLSCQTAQTPFGDWLKQSQLLYAAPMGKAKLKTVVDRYITCSSETDFGDPSPWVGNLKSMTKRGGNILKIQAQT